MSTATQDRDLADASFAEVSELLNKYKVRKSSDPEGTLSDNFFGKPSSVFEVTHGCGHTRKIGVYNPRIFSRRSFVKDCMLSELERCFDCYE